MSQLIKGLDKLKDSIEKIQKIKAEFGKEMLARVVDKTPVATGRLKGSWTLEMNENNHSFEITNKAVNDEGVPYAIFVEFGTIHMRGAFMLNRTLAESTDILRTAKAKVGL